MGNPNEELDLFDDFKDEPLDINTESEEVDFFDGLEDDSISFDLDTEDKLFDNTVGEEVDFFDGFNKDNQQPKKKLAPNTEDMGFTENLMNGVQKGYYGMATPYKALFDSEDEAKNYQKEIDLEYPTNHNSVGGFIGNVVGGLLPTVAALIPGPQQTITIPAMLAHYGISGGGSFLMNAWSYEDETGKELDNLSKALIVAGGGVIGFLVNRFGFKGLEKSINRMAPSAVGKIGSVWKDVLEKGLGDGRVTKLVGTITKELGKGSFRSGIIEGAEEGTEQLLENGIKELYDERRTIGDLLENIPSSIAGGAVGGALISSASLPFGNAFSSDTQKTLEETRDIKTSAGKFRQSLKDNINDVTDEQLDSLMFEYKQHADRLGLSLNEFLDKHVAGVDQGQAVQDASLLQSMRAFHGTPHEFDKFDIAGVGTGEGVQAFGYGLYFTSQKGIAKFYAEKLGKPSEITYKSDIDEQYLDNLMLDIEFVPYDFKKHVSDHISRISGNPNKANMLNAILETDIKLLEHRIKRNKEWIVESKASEKIKHNKANRDQIAISEKNIEEYQTIINSYNSDQYKSIILGAKHSSDSNLLEVNLESKDPENFKWLEWDEELDMNSTLSLIRDADPNSFYVKRFETRSWDPSGDNIYIALKHILGSDMAASEFLSERGFDGVKYHAGTLSGSQKDGNNNFVIFDDQAISIVQREKVTRSLYQTVQSPKPFIPDFTTKNNTEDAIALGKSLSEGKNSDLMPDLVRKLIDAREAVKEFNNRTEFNLEDDINESMKLQHRAQLYQESLDVALGVKPRGFDKIKSLFQKIRGFAGLNDRFNLLTYAGERSGVNNRGYGLHFTTKESVADYYMKKFNKERVTTADVSENIIQSMVFKGSKFNKKQAQEIANKLIFFYDKEFRSSGDHSNAITKALHQTDQAMKGKGITSLSDSPAIASAINSIFKGVNKRPTKVEVDIESKNPDQFKWLDWNSKDDILIGKTHTEILNYLKSKPELKKEADLYETEIRTLSTDGDLNIVGDLYRSLAKVTKSRTGDSRTASELLKDMGYDGNTYKIGGAHNFVVFDSQQVKEAQSNIQYQQLQGGEIKGALTQLDDGRFIISAYKSADITTIIHETGHLFRKTLDDGQLSKANELFKIGKDGWTREKEEEFADAWLDWHRGGSVENSQLRKLFRNFKKWLTETYKTLVDQGSLKDVKPDVKAFFEQMLDSKTIGVGAKVQVTTGDFEGEVGDIDQFLDDNKVKIVRSDESTFTTERSNINRDDSKEYTGNTYFRHLDKLHGMMDRATVTDKVQFKDKWKAWSYISSPEFIARDNEFSAQVSGELIDIDLEHQQSVFEAKSIVDQVIRKFKLPKKQRGAELRKAVNLYISGEMENFNTLDDKLKRSAIAVGDYLKTAQAKKAEVVRDQVFKKFDGKEYEAFLEFAVDNDFDAVVAKYGIREDIEEKFKRNRRKILKAYESSNRVQDFIPKGISGDYIIYDEKSGEVIGRAKTAKDMRKQLRELKTSEPEGTFNFWKKLPKSDKKRDKPKGLNLEEVRESVLSDKEDFLNILPEYISKVEQHNFLNPKLEEYTGLVNSAIKTGKVPGNLGEVLLDQIQTIRGDFSKTNYFVDDLMARWGEGKFTQHIERPAGAFKRDIARARRVMANLKLGYRPIAGLVNMAGGFGHTWTKLGSKYMQLGTDFLNTEEGKAFIKEEQAYTGIDFSIDAEGNFRTKIPWYKPLGIFQAAEPAIREHSLAANYMYAKTELGLEEDQAKEYARRALRFQNFTYNSSALPKIMRNPTGKLFTQFKTYLVKEVEFIRSLKGDEWLRYMGMHLALSGPRGVVYTLRSLPFLALTGLLEPLEEWLLKEKSGLARGLPGTLGVDVTAPATFQLPMESMDYVGPFLSDMVGMFKQVVIPLVQNLSHLDTEYVFEAENTVEGAGKVATGIAEADLEEVAKGLDQISLSRSVDWFLGTAAVWSSWNDIISQAISEDGWIKNSKGEKDYRANGWWTATKLALAASPTQKSVMQNLNRIEYNENLRRQEKMKWNLRTLIRKWRISGKLDNDLIMDMVSLGGSADAVLNRIKTAETPPEFRAIMRQKLAKKPDTINRFLGE